MRTIGVVTVARSDYGYYFPILKRIEEDPNLALHLIVSGTHLSPDYGLTIKDITGDGFEINEQVEMLVASDSPEGVSKSMGLGTIGFSRSFSKKRADILLLLGDRFEMHAAAIAALPFKIPLAHIHGGEITEGAIDDALRHSLTKLSHLHFVTTDEHARRVIQLGEEPWRVTVSGAPSLDNLHQVALLTTEQLEAQYGLCLNQSPLIVTYHPVTLEYEQTEWQINELLGALERTSGPIIFSMPNADTGNRTIYREIDKFVRSHNRAQIVASFGFQGYFSLMAMARAMVGNSSSGIIEAASFRLPVVNIGNRQKGRLRGRNVIDVGYSREAILEGINKAGAPAFRETLLDLKNPYGDGSAAGRIVSRLENVELNDRLIRKSFYDLEFEIEGGTGHGASS